MAANLHRGIFIGLGRAARRTLGQFLQQPRTEVAAIVDPRPAPGVDATAPVFANLEQALDQTDANVAFISSPSCFHAEQFLACAARGLHVWVEKPIALRLDDALAMQRAAAEADIKTATPYLAESQPVLAQAIANYKSGELGRLMQLFAIRIGSNGFASEGRGGHPAVLQPQYSGGWIHHHLCHLVDWALQIGGPVRSVHCDTDTTVDNAQPRQEEAVACVLRFERGGTATLVENQLTFKYHRYGIIGERGGLFIEQHPKPATGEAAIVIDRAVGIESQRTCIDVPTLQRQASSSDTLMRRFLDAIERNLPSPVPLARGIETLKVCEALSVSAQRSASAIPSE